MATLTASAPRRAGARRKTAGKWAANASAVLIGVLLVFPVYWLVATAFKAPGEIQTVKPQWFPWPLSFDNFSSAITRDDGRFWKVAQNSLIITSGVVVLSAAIAFLAAVAIGRTRFRGKKAYIILIIAVQMVPLQALIIPLFVQLSKFDLDNTRFGVILTYLAFVLPFTIWTLRGFVVNVPQELEEAALVDGCSRFGAFMRITVPLIAPGLVATSVYAFIQAWNEFLMASVILQEKQNHTLTVWLANFTTSRGTEWGPLMAASTLTAIPVVVFFLIVQRRMVSGLTAGAVKG